jgi:hypothetical protein
LEKLLSPTAAHRSWLPPPNQLFHLHLGDPHGGATAAAEC